MGMELGGTKVPTFTAEQLGNTIELKQPPENNSRIQPSTGFDPNDAGTTDDDEIIGDVNWSVTDDLSVGAAVIDHPFRNGIEPQLQLETELDLGKIEVEVELDNVGRAETQNIDTVITFPFFLDSSLGVGIENIGTGDANATLELNRQINESTSFGVTSDFNGNAFDVRGTVNIETY